MPDKNRTGLLLSPELLSFKHLYKCIFIQINIYTLGKEVLSMKKIEQAHLKSKQLTEILGEALVEANQQRTSEGNLLALHIQNEFTAAVKVENTLALFIISN